jgi:hypothetical protein
MALAARIQAADLFKPGIPDHRRIRNPGEAG